MKIYTIIFLLVLSSLESLFSQDLDVRFRVLDIKGGLSYNTVTSIIKDRDGYMWFGTKDGLDRYDGQNFTVYRSSLDTTGSLSKSAILSLYEDSRGTVWVGTDGGGLCKYNKESDSFTTFKADYADTTSISNNAITTIYEDKQGNLWVGTYYGLNLFDYQKQTFRRFLTTSDENSISSNQIASIVEDHVGNFWVATKDKGLNLLDRKTFLCKRIVHDKADDGSISGNFINTLLVDKKNNLWVGTMDGGLDLKLNGRQDFQHFRHSIDNPVSISGNDIKSIAEDEKGNLWIGTESRGINYFDVAENEFYYFSPDEVKPKGISKYTIADIYIDDIGIIWFGTSAGGVRLIDKNKPAFKHFEPPLESKVINGFVEDIEGNLWVSYSGQGLFQFDFATKKYSNFIGDIKENGLNNTGIVTMMCDSKGNLWLGTYGGGINVYNPKTKLYKHYVKGDKDHNLSNDKIYAIHEDRFGKIWVGTLGGGLNVIDLNTNTIKKYFQNINDTTALNSNYISTIDETKSGKILIGTFGGGVNIYNEKNDSFKSYTTTNSKITNDLINVIFVDKADRIWLGTLGGGLNLFNKETETFTYFGSNQGLANEVINGIVEDQRENLWLSTNKGISQFIPGISSFKNFDFHDGLQSKEYRTGSFFKAKNGIMYFGGLNGFDYFHPDSIRNNENLPSVAFVDLQIFNKPVKIGAEGSPLKKSLSMVDELILTYDQTVFTIEYTGISFTAAEKNQYAYKLDGFDTEWNYVGTQKKATYTNLNPGEYIFRVKASNNVGIWNEEGNSLKIIITPPFWKTWWFIFLVVLAIIFALYQFVLFRTRSIIEKKRELEKEVKKRTAELQEANLTLVSQKEELETQTEHLQEAYKSIKDQGEKLEGLYSDVKDSIRAAKEIQQSILPPQSFIKKYLPESFIFYKPKDVVSGDIYWFDVKNNKILIAAVDCTGHGVSGAFMSINAHHLINQSVGNAELVPSQILGRLNEGMLKEMNQQDLGSKLYDGMDISLCVLDRENLTLEFSGANLPLYLLRENQIIQLKGSRRAIGLQVHENDICFEDHHIKLMKDDVVYLFSDGFADQIGGAELTEKFMYPRFREFLISIGDKSMEDQLTDMENTFHSWKGQNDQLDDVLVMGIRI